MSLQTLRSKCALLAAICLMVLGAAKSAAADSITVEWDPSSGQVGYKVHVGVQSGSYTQHFDVGSGTLFTFQSATAGQRYCFAVSAYLLSSLLEGPKSNEVCGYSNAPPTLVNPGNRQSTVGQPTTLQLVGSDPASQPLTYSATGLPAGLTLMASTGFISGTPTTATTYAVTVRAFDGTLTASQSFTWTITGSTTSDTTRPTVTITAPTSAATYTATSLSMNLAGTAGDDRGVTQVSWANDRGGSGVASGTTAWNSTIGLQTGVNTITVTARDAAGNQASDVLTVTASGSTSPLQFLGITTNRSNPSPVGTPITFTALASGGTAPYQFKWTLFNGVSWNMVQQWTTNPSFTWTPTAAGTAYRMAVWVRSAGNTVEAPEVSGSIGFSVSAASTADTTPPSVAIGSPTTGATFSTTSSTINLTGTASDNVGLTQVRWANDRGGSGVGSGTTSWAASSIPLQSGSNVVTVTAVDAAGNQGIDVLSVTYSAPSADTAPPTISITTPSFTTTNSTVTVTGTAADNRGVTQVRWANQRGGSGIASGTTSWTASVPLQGGANTIIVTAVDAAGNIATDAVTVTSDTAGGGSGGGGGTGAAGLLGEYFSGINFATRRLTRSDPTVDFSWASASPSSEVPADNFSVRWTGYVTAPVSGAYTFSTLSNDGVRLWVNGKRIINNWNGHPATVDTGTAVTLQAGQRYAIRLEFYEGTGTATVQLRWAYTGQATQVIPASVLSR